VFEARADSAADLSGSSLVQIQPDTKTNELNAQVVIALMVGYSLTTKTSRRVVLIGGWYKLADKTSRPSASLTNTPEVSSLLINQPSAGFSLWSDHTRRIVVLY